MTEGHSFTFPDDSRGELDKALDDLMGRARDVLATQGRLRALLKANQAVIEHIDLPTVLRRIIEAAVELVGAQYGALGVVAADGSLEQFINVGMSAEQIHQIGHLPEGHGLLGAIIVDPHPIRIPEIAADARSVGFPAGHPPMSSFLGVPIRVRDAVYGNLYLSNQKSGEFSDEDEQLVTALAATAGIAIENARLFAETHRRQSWAAASAEITATLLSSEDIDVLPVLASRVLTLSDADVVWVLQPTSDPERMSVHTARGIDETRLEGMTFATQGSLSAIVLEAKQPRLIDDSKEYELLLSKDRAIGPVLAVPMMSSGLSTGVLLVGRLRGAARFAHADLEMAADFAGQASVAIELAAARADRQRMALLEDRGRIARDLHDHVIQQLFATGLELQSIAGSASPDLAQRIVHAVTNLDASISQIRTVIFALSVPATDPHDTVRHWIIDLANELAPRLARTPNVSFSGPVDLMITDDLAEDVVAVTREALVNVVKHASAQNTSIDLAVIDGVVRLVIVDDGNGANGSKRRSGVSNLEQRALRRGGLFDFSSDDGGTRVCWTVPLEASPVRPRS
ncbi:MAG: GAF domain-containing protein [Rhodoglobus sp.]